MENFEKTVGEILKKLWSTEKFWNTLKNYVRISEKCYYKRNKLGWHLEKFWGNLLKFFFNFRRILRKFLKIFLWEFRVNFKTVLKKLKKSMKVFWRYGKTTKNMRKCWKNCEKLKFLAIFRILFGNISNECQKSICP